jgi:hypothetical protein
MPEKPKAPLARLLERYSDAKAIAKDRKAARGEAKERLVNELLGRLKARPGESKDDLRKRLVKSKTAKLLKHRERADRPS